MVPKDVVNAFDELRKATADGEPDPPVAAFVTIAEGVVGALFSIAASLERIADSGEHVAAACQKTLAQSLAEIASFAESATEHGIAIAGGDLGKIADSVHNLAAIAHSANEREATT